ncbi:jg1349 [Pararge aegeria aegeria]|uniref:Jg1349 protein n=1 Tax=Pararge aegeria aegeria TaxID=348720 RepID=A0A8S4S404_9NEOP|nr:jg1349 [Pararge aegeria aegeria]
MHDISIPRGVCKDAARETWMPRWAAASWIERTPRGLSAIMYAGTGDKRQLSAGRKSNETVMYFIFSEGGWL